MIWYDIWYEYCSITTAVIVLQWTVLASMWHMLWSKLPTHLTRYTPLWLSMSSVHHRPEDRQIFSEIFDIHISNKKYIVFHGGHKSCRPPPSWISLDHKFLTDQTVTRAELRHRAKFCLNRWNCGGDMAIFRFFKMAAAAILDFWNFKFLTVGTVKRVELHHRAKFRPNRSDFLIFSHFES